MSVTRAGIRQVMGYLSGQGHTITATSNGTSTTFISTGFEDYALSTDDVFNRDWWLAVTTLNGDANEFHERPIEDYAASTTTATVPRAFEEATETGDVGELWRFRPSHGNNGITRAIRWLYTRGVHVPVYDETLVVGQLLSNGDFEGFTGGNPDSWTEASGNWTAETTRVIHGTNSITVTASGAAAQLTQNLYTSVNVRELVGRTIRIEGWVWCATASAARLRITFDGSTYTDGAYHGGDQEWEGPLTMFVQATVPSDATQMTVVLEVADGSTAYFDSMTAYIPGVPLLRYAMPSAIDREVASVWMQRDKNMAPRNTAWDTIGRFNPPRAGHRLRVVGRGRATEPSAETTSIELSGELIDLVAMKALAYAYQAEAGLPRSAVRDEAEALAQHWDQEAERLLMTVKVARPALHIPSGWRVEADGETQYLEFTRYGY